MASSQQRTLRFVVVGDSGTGKSSLIVACATESFPDRAPPVLPPTRLPADFFQDGPPIIIIDTSSRKEDASIVEAELKKADAIILTYACDKTSSLENLSRHWMPLIKRLQVSAPVVIAGCRLDSKKESEVSSLEAAVGPLMDSFPQIETCLECSALKYMQVGDPFFYAQKAVLHPMSPLFDQTTQQLKPRCQRALQRIFVMCDKDKDGVLSDAELNAFQVKCFSAPLQPDELQGVKRVVSEKIPNGVSQRGLTSTGFSFLHALFIERGRLETTWTVLRTFGYTDELKLREDLVPEGIRRKAPDQSVEFTEHGIQFLQTLFTAHDTNQDGLISSEELESVFNTAPENPFSEAPFNNATENSANGSYSLRSFLSLWAMLALLDPSRCGAHLMYLGLSTEEVNVALRVTKRKRADRKKGSSQREALSCLLIGPRGGGKSALLDAFLSRPPSEAQQPTTSERFAINIVGPQMPTGRGRLDPATAGAFLLVHEASEDHLPSLLSSPSGLSGYDCAAFVYDSSSMDSWERCASLLELVASSAELHGNELPCLLVAAKDDLPPHPAVFPHSAKVCAEMGVQSPLPVSSKLGDTAELWTRISLFCSKPNRSVPETSSARTSKATRRVLLRTAAIAAAGTAVAVVVIIGYRTYSQRQSALQ